VGVWRDVFTGTAYEYDEAWQDAVLEWLARKCWELVRSAGADAREWAGRLADFWAREYYELVFPVRFSHGGEAEMPSGQVVHLRGSPGIGFRSGLALRDGWPPLLAAGKDQWLVADHVCMVAALANLLCRTNGLGHLTHHIRVGCFLHEVWPHFLRLSDPFSQELPAQLSLAFQVASYLSGEGNQLPAEVKLVADLAHPSAAAGGPRTPVQKEPRFSLVVGAAQRLKRYVYEGQDLRSVRGASQLLDEVTEQLADEVAQRVGRECVLRDAGSVVECLVPAEQSSWWQYRIRSKFFDATGAVFAAVGSCPCSADDIFLRFGEIRHRAWLAVESDRDRAAWPAVETLPFEARCAWCGWRAAAGRVAAEAGADGGADREELICPVCQTRVARGRLVRGERVRRVVADFLGQAVPDLSWLGIPGDDPGDAAPPTLDELVPEGRGRDKLAVITFDGDNFGTIVQAIADFGTSLQWSCRTRNTVRVAGARSLWEAAGLVREEDPSFSYRWLPYEVVLLSGDEFTAIAWEAIALESARRFLAYTRSEFQGTLREAGLEGSIHFSGGLVTSGKKAPIRFLIEFAEDLQKVAKRHAAQRDQGMVHFLVTDSLSELPDRADEIEGWLCKRSLDGERDLWLTLRPLTGSELGFLLDQARKVIGLDLMGPLRRLAGAYLRYSPLVARLYSLYYLARSPHSRLHEIIGCRAVPCWQEVFPGLVLPQGAMSRLPLGGARQEGSAGRVTEAIFTPLWDLAEIAKTLR
jgi:hypothetical protein